MERRRRREWNGTREASQQESSVEKNPRGRVLAGTVYSSSCRNFGVSGGLLGGERDWALRAVRTVSVIRMIWGEGQSGGVGPPQQLQPNLALL
jgi:hypothetical protein